MSKESQNLPRFSRRYPRGGLPFEYVGYPSYDEVSKIPFPTKVLRPTLRRVNEFYDQDQDLSVAVTRTVVNETSELLPSRRILRRFRGIFDEIGNALFLYLQPSLAIWDAIEFIKAGRVYPPFDRLPQKLRRLLLDQDKLWADCFSSGLADRFLGLEGAEEANRDYEGQKAIFVAEWYATRPSLGQILREKNDPLKFIDTYSGLGRETLVNSGASPLKLEIFERGEQRFCQIYKAAVSRRGGNR